MLTLCILSCYQNQKIKLKISSVTQSVDHAEGETYSFFSFTSVIILLLLYSSLIVYVIIIIQCS